MQLHVNYALTLKNKSGKNKREFPLKVNFSTHEDRTVIFGPSGCGKSVTLQVIAGLLKPTTGKVELQDTVLFDSAKQINVPANQRRIGYVFQDYALFPHLSVMENAGYSLRQWPIPLSAENKQRIMEMLDVFGMRDRKSVV